MTACATVPTTPGIGAAEVTVVVGFVVAFPTGLAVAALFTPVTALSTKSLSIISPPIIGGAKGGIIGETIGGTIGEATGGRIGFADDADFGLFGFMLGLTVAFASGLFVFAFAAAARLMVLSPISPSVSTSDTDRRQRPSALPQD